MSICNQGQITIVSSITKQNQNFSVFNVPFPPLSWIEIDKNAFIHNITQFAQLVGSQVALAVVIKANAYGHGFEQIVQLCEHIGSISWLCTSNLSEALYARAYGTQKPILVLAHIDVDPVQAARHNISLGIHDEAMAHAISSSIHQQGLIGNIHIKVDTGLSRFGIPDTQAAAVIMRIARLPGIRIEGIYTHYASTDPQIIHEQQQRFDRVVQRLAHQGLIIPWQHTAKSTIVTRSPRTHYTMVRLGAGAYGLCAQDIGLPLRQVLMWKTRIIQIKTVPAGTYVGYNNTYQTSTEQRIALIPIGYYEGYPLELSNRGHVMIAKTGQHVPVVGRVCMNQCMLDVTQAHSVTIGDEIIILGDRNGVRCADLMEKLGGSNEREVPLRLSAHIPRLII